MQLEPSRRFQLCGLSAAALGVILAVWRRGRSTPLKVELYSEFLQHLDGGAVRWVQFVADSLRYGLESDQGSKLIRTTVPVPGDRPQLLAKLTSSKVKFGTAGASWGAVLGRALLLLVPLIYLVGMGIIVSRMNHNGGIEKKFKKRPEKNIGFHQVAGIDHALQEVHEIVQIFKNPSRYASIGARMPRGILLHGPPGTGKTLLSRALAAEAGVTLLYVCASDFVETLVGRGAARVRALWTKARNEAPSIIFIDELDAIGRKRNRMNGNEEREQTLAALLSEMDGFESQDSSRPIVVMAATNCVDVLDPALTRPGRFDRQIAIRLPDSRGRLAILECHAKKTPASGVDLGIVAAETEGWSGAELENLVNEAALLAVRENADQVQTKHFQMAVLRSKQAQGHATSSGPPAPTPATDPTQLMSFLRACTHV